MANAQIIEQKAARVKEVQEKIEKAKSVVFFDYRGLTVAEVTELRAAMRKENVEYVVIKNNVAARAAEAAKVDKAVEEMLKGTVAYAFGYEDEVAPARILKSFIKKFKSSRTATRVRVPLRQVAERGFALCLVWFHLHRVKISRKKRMLLIVCLMSSMSRS